MSDTQGLNGERDEAPQSGPDEVVRFWLDQIERYEKAFGDWTVRVEKIWKIYTEARRAEGSTRSRKLSLLWSNVSTLQPAVYARLPAPAVSRRFKDSDPVARLASELMERALIYTFEDSDLDSTLALVRDDFLLGSRGTVWVGGPAPMMAPPGPGPMPPQALPPGAM